MLARIVCAALLAAVPLAVQQEQEQPKPVPKNSIRVVILGCVKGRVLRAADVRQADTTSGIEIRSRTFRLEGKKDVMKGVKDVDGERAELTGLIRKSSLIEPGAKFMGDRVRVGGSATGPGALPDPAENVTVLDVETVQGVGGSCGA